MKISARQDGEEHPYLAAEDGKRLGLGDLIVIARNWNQQSHETPLKKLPWIAKWEGSQGR